MLPQRGEPVLSPPPGGVGIYDDDRHPRVAGHLREPVPEPAGGDAADRAPTLADIRDAGTIEEYASIVLLLHRTDKAKTECEVRIAKHRNGPTGLVKLYFDPERLRFRDFERRSR